MNIKASQQKKIPSGDRRAEERGYQFAGHGVTK
jgi:hypothetical protein